MPNRNNPSNFWTDILNIMDITIVNKSKKPLIIPKTGSLMVIANHPFGIIDGLILLFHLFQRKEKTLK